MRLRHFRGRKVHSPFVYGIIRGCLMQCSSRSAEDQIAALFEYLAAHSIHQGEVTCIVNSRDNRAVRRQLVESHNGTSFETSKFLCLFANERLPKQHFRL